MSQSKSNIGEAWKKDDDWRGIATKDERKKRQNRLNQRAYRRRNDEPEEKTKKLGFRVERFRIPEIPLVDTKNDPKEGKENTPIGSKSSSELLAKPNEAPSWYDASIPHRFNNEINPNLASNSAFLAGVAAGIKVTLSRHSLGGVDTVRPEVTSSLDSIPSLAEPERATSTQPLPSATISDIAPFLGNTIWTDQDWTRFLSHLRLVEWDEQLAEVPTQISSRISKFAQATQPQTYFPLSSDHLLHLIHHNCFRALITNKNILNERISQRTKYMETIIPSNGFICDGVSVVHEVTGDSMPPSLFPTKAQKTVWHASYLNMFPFPQMRENLIRCESTFNDYEFCEDIFGEIVKKNTAPMLVQSSTLDATDKDTGNEYWPEEDDLTFQRRGLIVWGESWDPDAWEVTPGFAFKWNWTLYGCEDLIASTNRWRAKRGEEPLRVALPSSLPAYSASISG
ncbi:hypothetical protein G7Y89_g4668 [Cudoniella acicularis]|uniref:BZIP domain-containing protein n=1 Tax=Cudoniella acicularis TaxID=354080 RepID=A0A8H4W6G4_9HELO|nr:hypothetical protein G7Y89_g4668 [Cudoniella acicularis]